VGRSFCFGSDLMDWMDFLDGTGGGKAAKQANAEWVGEG